MIKITTMITMKKRNTLIEMMMKMKHNLTEDPKYL